MLTADARQALVRGGRARVLLRNDGDRTGGQIKCGGRLNPASVFILGRGRDRRQPAAACQRIPRGACCAEDRPADKSLYGTCPPSAG
jgi:hypothetical protein